MRIALASDHVGFSVKASLAEALEREDHAVLDLGTHGRDSVDYPAMARAVAAAVSKGFVELGILVCETPLGGALAVNKCRGLRAAAGEDAGGARQAREKLDTNVLCLGGAALDAGAALAIAREWLNAKFSGDERDVRALEQIREIEGAAPARTSVQAPVTSPSVPPASAPPASADTSRTSDISPVLKYVASLHDAETKTMARRILEFVRNRFPQAAGAPTDDGFTFTLEGQHVITAVIGRKGVELQVGPGHVTTNRIRDADELDLTLALPSITKGFDAIKA